MITKFNEYGVSKILNKDGTVNYNAKILPSEVRLITAKIIDYIVWLRKDQRLSSITIQLCVSAVMHFYSMNDVTLNRKKIGMYIGQYARKQKDRAYTTEEIQLLLDVCDEKSKALVPIMTSTDVRIGSIPDLELRHISKIKEYNLYKISIYEGTKEEYYCFTTPEAAKASDTYLDYRERYGRYYGRIPKL